jgi:hypothetical protein
MTESNVVEGSQCVMISEAEHNALLSVVRTVEAARQECVDFGRIMDPGLLWVALRRLYRIAPHLQEQIERRHGDT